MARAMNIEVLEKKIEKAQQDVVRTKKAYDAATAALKDLLDKRDAFRKNEIMEAIAKSGKSYETIMKFIQSDESGE